MSVRETATAALAFRSTLDADPFSALTLAPSTTHKPWVADVTRQRRRSGSDAVIHQYEMIGDRIRRLSDLQPEPTAGSLSHVPVYVGLGALPPTAADFTADMHEEGTWAPLDVKLRNVLRQLYAVGSGGSAFPLKPAEIEAWVGIPHPELQNALHDLAEVKEEAREEGIPTPSDTAVANAQRLLHAMYSIFPRRFEVYPVPDGEIAIDVPGGHGRSVLLLCESSGGALCLVNMNGAHRRARYSSASQLPDGFLRDALAELERRSGAAA